MEQPVKRRKFLKTATGAIGVTSMAGCLSSVTGPVHIQGGLPMIPVPPWEEQKDEPVRMRLKSVNRVRATETVEKFGLSKRVEADIHGVSYAIQVNPQQLSLPVGGTVQDTYEARKAGNESSAIGTLGELAVFSVPRIEVAGQSFSPIDDLQLDDALKNIRVEPEADLRTEGDVRISDRGLYGLEPKNTLQAAYNGRIASVSNVMYSDTYGEDRRVERFQSGDPVEFAADAEVLTIDNTGSQGETQSTIIGAIERTEVDGGDIIKVGGILRDPDDSDPNQPPRIKMSSTPVTTGSITYDGTNYVRPDWCHIDASNLSDFVKDCLDRCSTDDCKIRCLTKFAYWDYETAKEYVECDINAAYMKLAIDDDPPIAEVVKDVYTDSAIPSKS